MFGKFQYFTPSNELITSSMLIGSINPEKKLFYKINKKFSSNKVHTVQFITNWIASHITVHSNFIKIGKLLLYQFKSDVYGLNE